MFLIILLKRFDFKIGGGLIGCPEVFRGDGS